MKSKINQLGALFMLLTGVLLFSNTYAQTGKYTYENSQKEGLSILEQKSEGIILNYTIKQFDIANIDINGSQKHQINLPAHFLPNNEGAPNLPGNGNYIALENGATASYEILEIKTEIIQNVEVAPAPRIPMDNEDTPLLYQEKQEIYSSNTFYPESPITLSDNLNLRGFNTVILGVTPFQYNPITKELKVIYELKIKLIQNGGDGYYGEERLRSKWWDPIISDALLNRSVIPKIDYSKQLLNTQNKENEEYEYLIITANSEEYQAWADSIRIFRNMQGIKTGVVTLAEIGGNNVNTIEDYVDDIYANWSTPPAAILLLGDYGEDDDYHIVAPIYDNYCASDNIYSDIDGDHLPDIVFARITANNEEQLSVMVRKFLSYERNPPTSADFYNHPITALGWQTERWFQVCSESVGGFWKNELGKDPVRINAVYQGNPAVDPWSTAPNTASLVNYFGPEGLGYLPQTPGELGGFSGGSSWDVANAINNGSFMLQHRDHGNETGWGEPAFNSSTISNLTNTDLTYIFSINCLTGKYNHGSEVFAEKFHRYTYENELSGALGILAASEVSYSFVNDTYVWGIFDYMWPEFLPDYGGEFPEIRNVLPAFASAYGKHYLAQSNWPYNSGNKRVTYHLFHHHGDAFLNVYTEVPQDLDIEHGEIMVSGYPSKLEIKADEGSLIALSVGGELMGTAVGTGDYVDVETDYIIPGTMVDIVVTKQNYFRYQNQVQVIPPEGPYVIEDNFTINDATGNNNGIADHGETIYLSVDMENVGNDLAENVSVTISIDDEYVTIQDNEDDFGNIPSLQVVGNNDAFCLQISNQIPDQHLVNLLVIATDGENEWESYINFHVDAPDLSVLSYNVNELVGNGNIYFDPGEMGEIIVKYSNIGHSRIEEINTILSTTNEFATVTLSEVSFEKLDTEEIIEATYTIEFNNSAPLGEEIPLLCTIGNDNYETQREFISQIGLTFENWETGDLTNFDWLNNSSQPWQIDEEVVYEGENALRSGAIDHSGNTILDITYTSIIDDSISFFRKVSSEKNDFLRFYINNAMVGLWSGEKDWERVSYFIEAGENNFKWVYTKNANKTEGQDCAWVDFIAFPQPQQTTVWTGLDFIGCQGEDILLNARATYYESVQWETYGSGTFEDATLIDAVYSPSEQDYSNGSVTLKLTINGTEEEILTDEITITFNPTPTAPSINIENTVIDVYSTTSSAINANEATFAINYIWTITPEDAGEIIADNLESTINWNSEYRGEAIIRLEGENVCGIGEADEKTITLMSTVGYEENDKIETFIIYPNPNNGNFRLILELSNKENTKIEIINLLGESLWNKDFINLKNINETYALPNLSKGTYLIKVQGKDFNAMKKLVIQ